MADFENLNLSEEQKLYNAIEILSSTLRDAKKDLKASLEDDSKYSEVVKREEELLAEYEDRLKAIREEKKAVVEAFKAKEATAFNKVDGLKIQLEGRKDALVQCFMRNMKQDVPTTIYKERSNGKKVRVEISLNPKMKVVKGEFISDEDLRNTAVKATEKVIAPTE